MADPIIIDDTGGQKVKPALTVREQNLHNKRLDGLTTPNATATIPFGLKSLSVYSVPAPGKKLFEILASDLKSFVVTDSIENFVQGISTAKYLTLIASKPMVDNGTDPDLYYIINTAATVKHVSVQVVNQIKVDFDCQ